MTSQNDALRAPLLALSLLTRLPIRLPEGAYENSARAAWAYPVVGVVTGLICSFAAWVALGAGLPVWVAALVYLGAGMVITGAMHEDGLADTADGFWGGWDRGMRLKIMRDSQIGTYGVLTLLVVQALRFGAILHLLETETWLLPLVALHVASRAVMPVIMAALPHARSDGLSKSVGQVSALSAASAAAIGIACLWAAFGTAGLALAVLAGIAATCVALIAKSKIGGQTGDVLGASQQITETLLLLALLT